MVVAPTASCRQRGGAAPCLTPPCHRPTGDPRGHRPAGPTSAAASRCGHPTWHRGRCTRRMGTAQEDEWHQHVAVPARRGIHRGRTPHSPIVGGCVGPTSRPPGIRPGLSAGPGAPISRSTRRCPLGVRPSRRRRWGAFAGRGGRQRRRWPGDGVVAGSTRRRGGHAGAPGPDLAMGRPDRATRRGHREPSRHGCGHAGRPDSSGCPLLCRR